MTEDYPTSQQSLNILVVDDNIAAAGMMLMFLESEGYKVDTAENIADARSLAKENSYNIVIGDLTLPDGDGLELMEDLAKSYGMKGIVVTGLSDEEIVARTKEAGFTVHLVKPIDLDDLLVAIKQVWGK